jgi:hypothetical protein
MRLEASEIDQNRHETHRENNMLALKTNIKDEGRHCMYEHLVVEESFAGV